MGYCARTTQMKISKTMLIGIRDITPNTRAKTISRIARDRTGLAKERIKAFFRALKFPISRTEIITKNISPISSAVIVMIIPSAQKSMAKKTNCEFPFPRLMKK